MLLECISSTAVSGTFPLGARGERPVFFAVKVDKDQARALTSIPGVARAPGGFACTWDVAHILAARLGRECPRAPVEWNLSEQEICDEQHRLPGIERYRALGLGDRLRDYQKVGAFFLARRAYALQCDPMRCIAGTTKIIVNRAGCARRMTLSDLVEKFNGTTSATGVGRAWARHELRGPSRRWRHDIDTFVPCFDEEGSIISNRVVDAHSVGMKEGYRVVTQSSRWIIASKDHQFRTPEGYARLHELAVGDQVLVRTRTPKESEGPRANPYRVLSVKNHPNARVYEVNRKDRPVEIVHHVLTHRLIYEAVVLNGMSLEEFCTRVRSGDLDGLGFLDPDCVVHHKDEDATNNRPENLALMRGREEHSRALAEDGYQGVLWRATPESISNIEPASDVEMFDLEMADPYRNFVADDFVVHNSGKSFQALAGAVLAGARRVLVVAPALAKYVWADEIAKWLQEPALILEGRAGDEARKFCVACGGRGRSSKGGRCAACKMRNGQSSGFNLFNTSLWAWDEQGQVARSCSKHPDARPASCAEQPVRCTACLEEIHHQIDRAHWVIVNYDLLVAQKHADAAGQIHSRDDLQGWAPVLGRHVFDLAVADECHMLRGFTTNQSKKGQTRRERFNEVVANIPRVWGLTGTPVFGYVRDLWGQIDAISNGVVTGTGYNERLPFAWHAYFCDGKKDDYGWRADGRSLAADTELPTRLDIIKIQRPRSLILSQMPPKVRQVIRLDPNKTVHVAPVRSSEAGLAALLAKTFDAKIDAVVENVVNEFSEGLKTVVFVFLRQSSDKLAVAIESAIKKNDVRTRMREVDARVWHVHGSTDPKSRFEMARAFREHVGAGAFVATIDSVQVAVSLKGASSVHFADLHWQPAALLQAEDRPYEVGITGLTIMY